MSQPPVDYADRLEEARRAVLERIDEAPRIALILGSGLGAFADHLDDPVALEYDTIPGWPISTVEGHAGRLIFGRSGDHRVVVMQGRVHLYEGYAPWEVVFPVRVLALLGCTSLLVSNAAGAVNRDYAVGDLMLIRDHLNLQGTNACIGPNIEALGPRFFDMTYAYDREYRERAHSVAGRLGMSLREGVYAAMLGPSYETPAEIHMLETIGADAVGMSTVPEVLAARHTGMRVIGISCCTNMAAGVLDEPLDHEEVMETADRVRESFVTLISALVDEVLS